MEGIFFYWFCWLLWIIVTFFMPKSKQRSVFAIWILLAIIFSNQFITIERYKISVSYILILIGGFVFLATLDRKALQLFSAFTIMIGFTGLLIWEANAPVWIFMPRILIMTGICVLLTVIITKKFFNRITLTIIGLCSGECLYRLLLSNYSIIQTIGDFLFLDQLLFSLVVLLLIESVRKGKDKAVLFLLNKTNNI